MCIPDQLADPPSVSWKIRASVGCSLKLDVRVGDCAPWSSRVGFWHRESRLILPVGRKLHSLQKSTVKFAVSGLTRPPHMYKISLWACLWSMGWSPVHVVSDVQNLKHFQAFSVIWQRYKSPLTAMLIENLNALLTTYKFECLRIYAQFWFWESELTLLVGPCVQMSELGSFTVLHEWLRIFVVQSLNLHYLQVYVWKNV